MFNSFHIGRNITLSYSKVFDQHNILVDIKYQINSLVQDNQNKLFEKRFYATSWGLVLGYNYSFQRIGGVVPYVFYEMQNTNSNARNEFMFPVGEDQDVNVCYIKD